jgi:acyl-phosphate glycerol 3-phosphate acyltransferase
LKAVLSGCFSGSALKFILLKGVAKLKLVLPVILGYVLGSVPIGFLVARYWGHIDIRHYGSGNIGTTNVFRTLGFYPGSIVLIGDIGKGVIAVLLGKWLGGEQAALLAGLAAILGHSWSIFLSFKGGRGVATGAGVFLALTPKVILIAALIWILVIAITWVSRNRVCSSKPLAVFTTIVSGDNRGKQAWDKERTAWEGTARTTTEAFFTAPDKSEVMSKSSGNKISGKYWRFILSLRIFRALSGERDQRVTGNSFRARWIPKAVPQLPAPNTAILTGMIIHPPISWA